MAGTGRHEGLRRVLRLIARLQGMRYAPSLEVLARDLDVCPRTIRRDLELLESVGYPVPQWRINHLDDEELWALTTTPRRRRRRVRADGRSTPIVDAMSSG